MKIRSVRHKGLRRLIEKDDPTGLQPAAVDKIRKIIAFLQDMERVDELRTIPVWQVHQLSGNRKGAWSLFVTRNWRITFRVDGVEAEIIDLDFEDYH
ncbi:MAG: type II toxin-antitoxin system RelE/ParE family toxin [Bauldia sp.]